MVKVQVPVVPVVRGASIDSMDSAKLRPNDSCNDSVTDITSARQQTVWVPKQQPKQSPVPLHDILQDSKQNMKFQDIFTAAQLSEEFQANKKHFYLRSINLPNLAITPSFKQVDLSQLLILNLQASHIKTSQWLESCKQLQFLNLSHNLIDIAPILQLTKLQELYLSQTQLKLHHVANWPFIQVLDLTLNLIQDQRHVESLIRDCRHLKVCAVQGNKFEPRKSQVINGDLHSDEVLRKYSIFFENFKCRQLCSKPLIAKDKSYSLLQRSTKPKNVPSSMVHSRSRSMRALDPPEPRTFKTPQKPTEQLYLMRTQHTAKVGVRNINAAKIYYNKTTESFAQQPLKTPSKLRSISLDTYTSHSSDQKQQTQSFVKADLTKLKSSSLLQSTDKILKSAIKKQFGLQNVTRVGFLAKDATSQPKAGPKITNNLPKRLITPPQIQNSQQSQSMLVSKPKSNLSLNSFFFSTVKVRPPIEKNCEALIEDIRTEAQLPVSNKSTVKPPTPVKVKRVQLDLQQ